ncbi:hypothetical protein NC796_03570 [Aliifodinibius sp. S!AR15-10]|uniref:hypothetical protein n=1 Tax=Aliifodinibius sp. S!AR15-10 TaxID=2950437 RepID=UPI002866D85C|nr:hypothetical protein [Aliifodinibius sp. S!AR15-10]MDR8390206.1 hypothetical protein [Aliifodinibius sp. S!AR15-10]
MEERLFKALRQQLVHEITFVKQVTQPYQCARNTIIDFEYRGNPCKLVLNGKLMLETNREKVQIESYQDLIQGLIQLNYSKKEAIK